MKAFLVAFVFTIASCGASKTSSTNSAKSSDQKLADPAATSTLALTEKFKTTQKKIAEFQAQNDLMCKMVDTQRKTCPLAAATFRAAEDALLLGCTDPSQQANIPFLEIDITAPAGGKIFLTSKNNTWQSSSVGTGQRQKLTWGTRKSDPCSTIKYPARNLDKQTVRSPRIIEVPDLFLNFDPDSCATKKTLTVADIPNFKLYVGGQEVFNRSDLQDGPAGLHLSTSKLLDAALNSKCIMEPEKLQAELLKAIQSAQSAPAPAPAPAPAVSPVSVEAQKTIDKDFAREANRHAQLKSQLLGKQNVGCWGYTKIRKLQIRLDGGIAPDKDHGLSGAAMQNQGNSLAYDFYFGQSFVYSTADETAFGIFKRGGGFISSDFGDREVQELLNIRIVKGGMAYQNTLVRKDGFLGIGSWTGFQRTETDLRRLENLSIFANDQLVYRRTGINFTFEGSNLVWPPNGGIEAIKDNQEFVNLMRRNDCPNEL